MSVKKFLLAMALMVVVGSHAWAQAPVSTWTGADTTGTEITYNPVTGDLDLVNTVPTSAVPGLATFTIYPAVVGNVPSTAPTATQAWMTQYGWTYTPIAFDQADIELDFGKSTVTGSQGQNVLPVGTYLLANLPTGLGAADFGNSYSASYDSSNNQLGSDYFGSDVGTTDFQSVVILQTPEPTAVVGLLGASMVGLVGFAGRRFRKAAV
ncbi:MAG: hypothetical protein ACLP9L_08690 [Thermoguttaceae bacterium]